MKKCLVLSAILALLPSCAWLGHVLGGKSDPSNLEARWKTVTLDGTSDRYNLVRRSLADLGFEESVTLKAVYDAAEAHGLGLCPNRLGIPIRLSYQEQPDGERLFIGMNAVKDPRGDVIYTIVSAAGTKRLDILAIDRDTRFNPENKFIFVSKAVKTAGRKTDHHN